jgi:hypothetical protein
MSPFFKRMRASEKTDLDGCPCGAGRHDAREHCSQRSAAHAPGAAQRTSGALAKRERWRGSLDREKPCELNPGGILVYLHNMIWERFPIVKAAPTFKRKGRRSLAPRREKSITSAGTVSDPIVTSVEGSSAAILTARCVPHG